VCTVTTVQPLDDVIARTPMPARLNGSDGGAAFPMKEEGLATLELTELLRAQGSASMAAAIACSMEARCGQIPPLNSSFTAT